MTTSELMRIQPLTLTQLGPAVRVLSRAFDQYPLLRYCFAEPADAYAELTTTMFRLSLSRRIVYEGVTLGVSHGSTLAGVAGVSLPDHGAMPEAMRAANERLNAAMGSVARERFSAYGEIVARYRPQAPHLFLGVLGVQPFLHGMGYGRALLEAVHAMAAAHPTAQGVYLDTEHAANVDLYRHFGYDLIGADRIGPVGVWCLYRPNGAA
jgi:GNAT superfamily N-acetyltransferase